jgi:hypothetical protein
MLLASTLNNELIHVSTPILGAVSIFEIYMNFIEYLEKKSHLESTSIYFLLKAKKLAEIKK